MKATLGVYETSGAPSENPAPRLLAVADCFDALTSSRAYRGALDAAQALEVLAAGAGTQFEPAFVEAFVRIAPRVPPGERRGVGPSRG